MIVDIIGWIIFGLVVGAIARYVLPGEQPMGLIGTMLLGVAGSFVGGFVGFLFTGGSPVQTSGWIGSVIGAVGVLAFSVYRGRRKKSEKD